MNRPAPEPIAEFSTQAALRAFGRPASGTRLALQDERLLSYRHPRERLGLAVALAAVAAIVVVAGLVAWAAAVLIVALLALTAVVTRLRTAQHLARAAEVTPTQFAHLHAMVAELRRRFRMPVTRVFVTQSAAINASSSGLQEPYAVVLTSALVDALDADELKSVLGHELGHIKFGHTRWGVLLGGVDTRALALPFPINLVASLRDALFLWWQRSTEMSADRAGILACGRPSAAISAQVKVSVGPTLSRHVNLRDLAQQAADLHTGLGRIEAFLSELGASHPFLVNRIQAMVDFVAQVQPVEAELPTDPALPPPARLVARTGAHESAKYPLNGRPLLAGRSPSSDIRLRDRAVSRQHFEIAWQPGAYVIRDLGSHNGTFVNGERVQTARLQDGDVVRVGFTDLEFQQETVREDTR